MNKAHIVFADSTFSCLMDEIALAADRSLAKAGWQGGKVDLADRRRTWHGGTPACNADQEAADVRGCDLLALIFPILWCAAPASLKQWIELVFSQELACQGRPMNNRGCMQGRSAIVVAALEDADSIPRPDSIEAAMSDMLRPLLEGTLAGLSRIHCLAAAFHHWHGPGFWTGNDAPFKQCHRCLLAYRESALFSWLAQA